MGNNSALQEGIKPEFLKQIDELKVFIFNRMSPMKAGNRSIKASEYLVMARAYIAALNSGAIPTITDAWGEVVEG